MTVDAARLTFEGKEVTVTFDPRRCMHSGNCLRSLPGVFDGRKDPWIQPDGATAERVAGVVARCPSGALQILRRTPAADAAR
jgi:uncharacterized Fe-S cluster protein YjdI